MCVLNVCVWVCVVFVAHLLRSLHYLDVTWFIIHQANDFRPKSYVHGDLLTQNQVGRVPAGHMSDTEALLSLCRLERLQRIVTKVQMESGNCEEQLNRLETLLQTVSPPPAGQGLGARDWRLGTGG